MAVVRFEISRREPFADGALFGEVGAYERIDGNLHFAVDPAHDANAGIVDLDLAHPAGNRVHFSSDLTLVHPRDASRGNGTLLLDVPNRGTSTAAAFFNRKPPSPGSNNVVPGDGFIFRHGFSLACVGWQTDCAPFPHAFTIQPPVLGTAKAPVFGQVMAEARPTANTNTCLLAQRGNVQYPPVDSEQEDARLFELEHDAAPLMEIERGRWRFDNDDSGGLLLRLESGFVPGRIYRVVYTAANPPVVGAGLLALRDAATFLRFGREGAGSTDFERVIAFGASQCGRLLRHLLYLGLNRDEAGVVAFDGVFALIAGARRGEFNHRFALPSSAAMPGIGEQFPFADVPLKDELTGIRSGLLDKLRERDAVPKIVYANSSREYWRGDACMVHMSPQGTEDIEPDPNARIYHFAGTQHTPGRVPQFAAMPALGADLSYGMNVVDYTPLTRAVLVNLDAWLSHHREPPPSRFPRLADGTAVTRAVNLSAYRGLPGVTPVDATRLPINRALDLGPQASEGIGEYPPKEGEAYPTFVAGLDEDLNELIGVRLPDLTVPVGSHTGWNAATVFTGDPMSSPRSINFGLTRFFSRSEEEAHSVGDSRKSLNLRYAGRNEYVALVRQAAQQLIDEGYVLLEDLELVVSNCSARYDEALKVGPFNPTLEGATLPSPTSGG
jgi:hypothetical protein